MKSPYPACGGRVSARFIGMDAGDRFSVLLSLDGKKWKQVWQHKGSGSVQCQTELDRHLEVKQTPPKYRYFIRIVLASAAQPKAECSERLNCSTAPNERRTAENKHAVRAPRTAHLAKLTIETDLMTNPHALPRLSLGRNKVVYTDRTPGPHQVTVTHRWQESNNVTPPAPPAEPINPKNRSLIQNSTVVFRWPTVQTATRYHIQVSRTADMTLPYRPSFDVIVKGTILKTFPASP